MISSFSNLSNLKQRLLSAIVGVIIVVVSLITSEWTYFVTLLALCTLTQLEFYKLVGIDGMIPLKTWGTFTGMCLFSLSFLVERETLPASYYFLIFPPLSLVYFIKLYRKADKKPFTNIAFTFLGIIYVALPFSLLNVCAYSQGYYSHEIILGCLLILWASDTGAYFAGVNFGRTKLFERVSPKKSWEGSIGGAITAMGMAFAVAYFYLDLFDWQWLCIGGIIVVAGTYGDLVESLFKRSIMIKDSGRGIPGHGGFLDRFDGLLLAAPFIATFLKLF
ncbi:phosphatidate cytidylyltransferase [Roseivirga sp. BDSF3-8]|uniref:phosphatidate cytidylyltransferase n=1 Tax=Roseivirga sp. BDSF3-8 TaxID=3241598 RepID=UPI003532709D